MKSPTYSRYECAICGKGVQNANMVSFSKQRTKIVRKPNLHTHRLKVEGQKVKIKVCTSCKRAIRSTEREAQRLNAKQ